MIDLAVIILTFNERLHIERAIAGVRDLARQIFVVDSFSTDGTPDLARAAGATVIEHAFESHARQVQWAIDTLPIETAWVMRLDADEVVEPSLAAELARVLPTLPADVTGANINRKHIFMGRWIRHGGRYPMPMLRIWRCGCARVEDRWMDEHMLVEEGRVVDVAGGFADHNLAGLTHFIDKHNRYASREAYQVVAEERGLIARPAALTAAATHLKSSLVKTAKDRIYNRIPYYVAAPAYFLYRYGLRLGFLDGVAGLAYHLLQGLWYRFLVGAKIDEMRAATAGIADASAAIGRLRAIAGILPSAVDGHLAEPFRPACHGLSEGLPARPDVKRR